MAKLFEKVNVLVKSSLRGVLDADRAGRRGRADSARPGDKADRHLAALRARIDQALDEEDRLVAECAGLERQIADWDRQADEALARGDEASARHAIRQMQLHERGLALLQADLAQHRRATAELIRQADELEALVAEARREQADVPIAEALAARLSQPVAELHTARPTPETVVDERTVDDDLARRRARLSQ